MKTAAMIPAFHPAISLPRKKTTGIIAMPAMTGTQDETAMISTSDAAPPRRQISEASTGVSGPQSIAFPAGYAVMGSNQL